VDVVGAAGGTSRRSLFRKALAAAAAVAGAGALFDFSKRTARAVNGDPLTIGNTDPALLGPDTSSNTTQLDKDGLNAEPNLVLTNANGAGLDSTGSSVGAIGRGGTWGVEGVAPVGVVGIGMGARSTGVRGTSSADNSFGVQGSTIGAGSTGVQGNASGQSSTGVLGQVDASGQQGVLGQGPRGVKGIGTGADSIGVWGEGRRGVLGVATSVDGVGVYGAALGGGTGVLCAGNFVATGTKSAAVPHPDGSHRLLYCMESPECWFEDFGRGALAGGNASVTLDPDFVAVVNTVDYHVFLTPEGDSGGLYVSSRSATGFTVNEQKGGTSSLGFSYRVVARRKDVEAGRLAKHTLPALPTRT
jgi:hypothetical protein